MEEVNEFKCLKTVLSKQMEEGISERVVKGRSVIGPLQGL